MAILITIVHILVCLFLIAVVLLQSGKSADIAATFGGMGSQTAFGPRGAATLLSKLTTWCAVIFMITSIVLSIYASRRTGTGVPGRGSVLSGTEAPAQTPAQQGVAPGQNPTAPPAVPNNPAQTAPEQPK